MATRTLQDLNTNDQIIVGNYQRSIGSSSDPQIINSPVTQTIHETSRLTFDQSSQFIQSFDKKAISLMPNLSKIGRVCLVILLIGGIASASFFVGREALSVTLLADKHALGLVVASGALWGVTAGLAAGVFITIVMSSLVEMEEEPIENKERVWRILQASIGYTLYATAALAVIGVVASLGIACPKVGILHW